MPFPLAKRSLFDADALAYCARSGATDIAAISAFVRGIKSLGLWSSVVCWPLRSAHNAGTGTTVHALGGMEKYTGTLTNGPAWSSNGIVLSPNHYVSIPAISTPPAWTEFTAVVAIKTDASNSNSIFNAICVGSVNNPTNSYFCHNQYGPNGQRQIQVTGLTGGSRLFGDVASGTNVGIGWYFASCGTNNLPSPASATGFTEQNGSRNSTSSGSGVLPRTATGGSTGFLGTQSTTRSETSAGVLWFTSFLTTTQIASVTTLFKNTLGQGLALP